MPGLTRISLLALVLALLALPVSAQQIYKWVDEQGRVQYTQTPPPKGVEATKTEINPSKPTADRSEYCLAIQSLASKIASLKASGIPLAAVQDSMGDYERQHSVNVSIVAIKELAAYVYNAGQYGVDAGLSTRVYNACLGGSFGSFAMKGTPRSGGSPNASGGASIEQRRAVAQAGTGWVTHGMIATNYHVIEGKTHFSVVFSDGTERSAESLSNDRENDVALLKVEGKLPPGLPLAKALPGMGADVFTLGYPHTDIMGKNAKLATGIISATSGLQDDPRFFQISVPVQSGNSGGPLINHSGEVVGIVTAKLSADRVFAQTGDLPQNVNYAVKIEHLRSIVDLYRSNVAQELPVKTGTLEQLATRISPSVVLVIAE
ncbi:trypsin-like peptidase domain-containing protein [Ahniella affigens]|nr:trypsin-like peptidase domain-containing protein [Ahniella affigens]